MNMPLLFVGFAITAIAAFVNFKSDLFVKNFNLKEEDLELDSEYDLDGEEKEEYILSKATLKVKKVALLILLVGIILILIAAN